MAKELKIDKSKAKRGVPGYAVMLIKRIAEGLKPNTDREYVRKKTKKYLLTFYYYKREHKVEVLKFIEYKVEEPTTEEKKNETSTSTAEAAPSGTTTSEGEEEKTQEKE